MASTPPPAYLPTIYDETLRSKSYMNPAILSMANRPNLVGHLEYHAPTTDGSFSIAVASGEGVFISKALLESIPSEHRPTLDTSHANQTIETLTSGTLQSIGTTFIPFILTNMDTGVKFRIVVYAIVIRDLFMNMFIGGYRSLFRDWPSFWVLFWRGSQCQGQGYLIDEIRLTRSPVNR